MLLIDFAKAFDRVSHKKLLMKLYDLYQFSSSAINLVRSYLCGRSQAVFCNDSNSSFQQIVSGVPQGSVLGPLLFSLFINDLPSVLDFCSIHLFADDVQIYLCDINSDNLTDIARKINHDLQKIHNWSQQNLLAINPSKTKALLIGSSRNNSAIPSIFLNGEFIQFVDKADNLGVVFRSDLNWDNHINSQCGKIFGSLKRLNLVTKHFDVATKIRLFKALILPHFIFSDFIYSNANLMSVDRLRVALNSCVRYVYNLPRFSRVSHLHKNLIGCSFQNFYKLRSCLTLFKIINTRQPYYLFSKLTPLRTARTRNFLIPHHRSAYYSQSMFARGIAYWNQLPLNIKSNNSMAGFRRDLREHFAA